VHCIYADYLLHLEMAGADEHTIILNRRALDYADRFLASIGKDAKSAEPQDFELYFHRLLRDGAGVASKGALSPGTVGNSLSTIRAAYQYALRLRRIDYDPTITCTRPKSDYRSPETFTNDQLRRIWAECIKPNEIVLFGLLAFTGMRQMEIGKLQWEQVDFDADLIRLHGRGHGGGGSIGKGGKARDIPIHPELRQILVAHSTHSDGPYVLRSQKGSCYSPQGMRDILTALLVRAAVPHAGFHQFRRTFNSSLMENDAIETYVEMLMGHAPKTINRRFYQRHAAEKLAATIRLVYLDDPILTASRPALNAV
jgi:integrase